MTDYVKISDYAAKDALLTGNPAKLVKGTEIGADFDAVAVAVATKADSADPTFTGVASFPDGSAAAPSITNTGDVNTGIFFPAADTVAVSTGGTERARIDSSGNVGIGVVPTARNNTRLQIVDGIGFPATQVASSDANTLDDYEEAAWNPSLNGFGGTGLSTAATYTKIGRLVHIRGYVAGTNLTMTAGSSYIQNLPFAPAAEVPAFWATSNIGVLFSTALLTTTTLYTPTQEATGSTMYFSAVYHV